MKKKVGEDLPEDQMIVTLAESFIANIIEAQKQSVDPFEAYTLNIQLRVFSSPHKLAERCLNGYRALLQEL